MSGDVKKKVTKHSKGQKIQSEQRETIRSRQARMLVSEMRRERKKKTLKYAKGSKGYNRMQEYKSNREIQILRENLKILIKTTVIEMKKAFDGLLVEGTWLRKVSDLEDVSTESSKKQK